MSVTVKHPFVSAVADSADTSLVRPSNWNADHTILGLGTAAELNAGVANGVATLDAGGKVPVSELPAAVLGALSYQGTWNASTNTPTLASGVGVKGYYYVVSVAGSTNLDGVTDWVVGDWAVFNGTVWQKVDNTDAVTSVNGQTGTVVLTAADVNAVPYTGATAAVDLNAKTLTNVSRLGINSTAVPDILLRAYGDNNSASRIAIRGYSADANSSSMRVAKFRGTFAAPQAPQSGDSLGKFELAGYGTTSSGGYPQVSFEGLATENWGAIARGAKAVVKVTPNTTTTQVTALTINQDSTAVFANTVTANGVLLTGNTGTVTSVAATAGTGISVSGSPITTSGTLTITNTAPDQTVSLTAGTGISTTGTYPNFTITNTAPSSGGTVTSVTGTAPVVSSGGNTPAISMAAATTSVDGYLTSTDWNTFNNKTSNLGTVTSVGGTGTVNGITLTGTVTTSGNLTLGGTLSGVSLTTQVSDTLPVANGGTGTATAFTAGSVVFAGASGVYSQDNAVLFFDNTNDRLGVGTATPNQKLQVTGSNSTGFAGATLQNSNAGSGLAGIQFSSDSTYSKSAIAQVRESPNGTGPLVFYVDTATDAADWSAGDEKMRISAAGNVGIGTVSPNGKLHVTGGTTNASNLATAYSAAAFTLTPKSTSGFSLAFGSGPSDFPYIQMSAAGSVASDMSLQPYGGNVGIGTTSPQAKLAVSNGGAAGLEFFTNYPGGGVGTYIQSYNRSSPGYVNTAYDALSHSFRINGTERAQIDSSGNLLVGTGSVIQTGMLSVAGAICSQTAGAGFSANLTTSSGDQFYFRTNSGANLAGYITCPTASTTSYLSISDYRLKENVLPMTGALAKIAQLNPCTYTWKADGLQGQGFIAHELQAVVPDCVAGEKDAIDKDGKPKYQGVDTSFLVATVVAALQELKADFDAYKLSHP